jgi:UDP-MurNAc hydroxylase
MQVTYLSSAAIYIEAEGVDVLCDPWLVDGAYYGSWCHYPEPAMGP